MEEEEEEEEEMEERGRGASARGSSVLSGPRACCLVGVRTSAPLESDLQHLSRPIDCAQRP
eukprot:9017347-Pyramimonas_sp.AAC.1